MLVFVELSSKENCEKCTEDYLKGGSYRNEKMSTPNSVKKCKVCIHTWRIADRHYCTVGKKQNGRRPL